MGTKREGVARECLVSFVESDDATIEGCELA